MHHAAPTVIGRRDIGGREDETILLEMSTMLIRLYFSSCKRQRVDVDDVLPAQSASQVGSISVTDLSDRTTLTAPQRPKRSSSPTLHLTELRTATPSITLSPFDQVGQPSPVDVAARIYRLRSRLRLDDFMTAASILTTWEPLLDDVGSVMATLERIHIMRESRRRYISEDVKLRRPQFGMINLLGSFGLPECGRDVDQIFASSEWRNMCCP